jgi:hypothetical protein
MPGHQYGHRGVQQTGLGPFNLVEARSSYIWLFPGCPTPRFCGLPGRRLRYYAGSLIANT